MNQWKETEYGNQILEADNFFISFSQFVSPPETALVVNKKYYILSGDFTKEYEEVIDKGLEACLEIFKKYKDENISFWSNDLK